VDNRVEQAPTSERKWASSPPSRPASLGFVLNPSEVLNPRGQRAASLGFSFGPLSSQYPFSMDDPPLQARFAKRYLDGLSWVRFLTRGKLMAALNLEVVHEHIFFLKGDQVMRDIGYSEKGKRFSEADYGKSIRTLDDVKKNGYWFVGRAYDGAAAEEALDRIDDGHYYSIFSNQCQDWADRVRKMTSRVEKERGVTPSKEADEQELAPLLKERPPTVPASASFGILALLLGVGALMAPFVAASVMLLVMGIFFVVAGVADVAYALHNRNWWNVVGTLLFALLWIAGGVFLLLDRAHVASWLGEAFIISLGIQGLLKTIAGLRGRPFLHWIGTLASGLGLLAAALLLQFEVVQQTDRLFGLLVGGNLLLGGFSTLWLNWTTKQAVEAESEAQLPGASGAA